MNNEPGTVPEQAMPAGQRMFRAIICVVILAAGISAAVWLVRTRPQANPSHRQKSAPFVETSELVPETISPSFTALGRVMPSAEVTLKAEVPGRIVWISPDLVPGGCVTQGTILARLDERDYRLAVERERASVQTAQSALALELGQQEIATREFEMISGESGTIANPSLALREPQRLASEAALDSARSALAIAALRLERTILRAPFDAVILDKTADTGDYAATGSAVARLAATSEYWVRVSIRSDQLALLARTNGNGEPVRVRIVPAAGPAIDARLLKVLAETHPEAQMPQLLVAVDGIGREHLPGSRLLFGSYVRVELEGAPAKGVVRIPAQALREGSGLWLVDPENRLRIVQADVLWSTASETVVSPANLPEGARLVTSGIVMPVEDMLLATGEPVTGPKGNQ